MLKRLLDSYRTMSDVLKAAVCFTIASVVQKGIVFVATPFYTRLLSTEEYGYYSTFISWMNILIIFATLNLSSGAFNNGMIKYPDRQDEYVSAMQGLSSVLTLNFFMIYTIFSEPLFKLTKLSIFDIVLMIIYFLSFPPMQFWMVKERFHFRYKGVVTATVSYSLLFVCLSFGFIFSPLDNKYSIIVGMVAAQAVLGFLFLVLNTKKLCRFYNREFWRFALKFNIPLVPHYLSGIILGQSDRIMISNIIGNSEAGIYSLAYSVSLALSIIITSVNATYTPWVYQMLENGEYKAIKKRTTDIIALFAVFIVLIILFAPEIMRVLGSEEYMEAVYILPSVAVSNLFTLIYFLFGSIEFYYEKKYFISIASVISAISNIILNYFFIHEYGYIAAGYTTLASSIINAVFHLVFVNYLFDKKNHIKLLNWRWIITISIGTIIVGLSVMLIFDLLIIRYIILTVMLIIMFIQRNKIINIIKEK